MGSWKRLAFRIVIVASLACLAAPAAVAGIRLPSHGDSSVHDLAGVITPADAATMERLHRELFARTGVAIVVITVKDLEGEPISDFAVRVGTEWGVGKKGEDRGIVVAMSTQDRRIFIATGYGVEGYLPDGRTGAILDRITIPLLRRGETSTALLKTSEALVAASAAEYHVTIEGAGPVPPRGRAERGAPSLIRIILTLIGLAFAGYLFIRNPILFLILFSGAGRGGRRGGFGGGFGGHGGGGGFGGFGGGGFGGGGAGRGF